MNHQIELSTVEWELSVSLVDEERKDLHSAVRRSRSNLIAHEEFQEKLRMVEGMVAKIQDAIMHPA